MRTRYTNPVHLGYMADPFVLTWQGEYYAYGTGRYPDPLPVDDRVFPLLHSRDLIHWESLGGALVPLPGAEDFPYWAPAVAEQDGTFYLYYSVDGIEGRLHQLRVAKADHPAGPFIDTGRILLPDVPFSIDAHPFRDPRDGQWYLYFADEYMDTLPIGTGILVVPLCENMIEVAGEPTVVLRGFADWQIHWREVEKHGQSFTNWYTIEGPSVVEREGRYYCFYSGGAWEDESYGVSYAVADHPLGPFQDPGSVDGPLILRTVPNKVIGPGHNSIVRGPDGVTDFLVYHAWDVAKTARRMCIDPLVWSAAGPSCKGPSSTPQEISTAVNYDPA